MLYLYLLWHFYATGLCVIVVLNGQRWNNYTTIWSHWAEAVGRSIACLWHWRKQLYLPKVRAADSIKLLWPNMQARRVVGKQCDQVARLFFQFLAVESNENLPLWRNVCQSSLEFCQVLNKPSKDCQRVLKYWQSGENSSNLVTLLCHSFDVGFGVNNEFAPA